MEEVEEIPAVERRALPRTGSSPEEAGSGRRWARSSDAPPCWANTDTDRPPENRWCCELHRYHSRRGNTCTPRPPNPRNLPDIDHKAVLSPDGHIHSFLSAGHMRDFPKHDICMPGSRRGRPVSG